MLEKYLTLQNVLFIVFIILVFWIIPYLWNLLKKKNPERMNNILYGVIIPIALGFTFLGSTISGYKEDPNMGNNYVFPLNILFSGYSGLLILVGFTCMIYGIKNLIKEIKLKSVSNRNEKK